MEILTIISAAIRGIGLLANNPALGGGSSVRFTEVNELLGILGGLIEAGSDAHGELKAFSEKIADMVREGRGPTRLEWESLRARSVAASETIQAAAAAVREEEEAEQPDPPDPAAAEAADLAEIAAIEATELERDLTDEELARLAELRGTDE